jgi:hypothetical protein
VFVAVGALPLILVHLIVVASEADLILAIARVEVLFLLFEARFANIANILSFPHYLHFLV